MNSTDLFATVAELAGSIGNDLIPADSVSLVPYLQARTHESPRRTIHAERFRPNYVPTQFSKGSPPQDYRSRFHRRAIRNTRFKLIQRHRAGRLVEEEFYDLLAGGAIDATGNPGRDDFEQNDLMRSKNHWKADAEIQEAYWSLQQELDVVLPPLP